MKAKKTKETNIEKKPAKRVFLKQYFVIGQGDGKKPRKAAFILHTCALNARKEFESRTGMEIETCQQTAESEFVKEDLDSHDFWKERRNWETTMSVSCESSPTVKEYVRMKERGEKLQAAKLQLKISDWETATENQLKKLNEILEK